MPLWHRLISKKIRKLNFDVLSSQINDLKLDQEMKIQETSHVQSEIERTVSCFC